MMTCVNQKEESDLFNTYLLRKNQAVSDLMLLLTHDKKH